MASTLRIPIVVRIVSRPQPISSASMARSPSGKLPFKDARGTVVAIGNASLARKQVLHRHADLGAFTREHRAQLVGLEARESELVGLVGQRNVAGFLHERRALGQV